MAYRIPCMKISMVRDGSISAESRTVNQSLTAATIVRELIGDRDREEFIVLMMDAKNHVTAVHSVAVGSLSLCIVHPREVFKAAVLANASGIIMAHNHPSGDPTPSVEDFRLTERLVQAGELMGIRVLDHIVLGDSSAAIPYVSFADNGNINPKPIN